MTKPSKHTTMTQDVNFAAFLPNDFKANSSYMSEPVLSAQEIRSIPVKYETMAPPMIKSIPSIIPFSCATEGRVIVPIRLLVFSLTCSKCGCDQREDGPFNTSWLELFLQEPHRG